VAGLDFTKKDQRNEILNTSNFLGNFEILIIQNLTAQDVFFLMDEILKDKNYMYYSPKIFFYICMFGWGKFQNLLKFCELAT